MHCGDGPRRQARDLVPDKPFRCIPCLAPVTKATWSMPPDWPTPRRSADRLLSPDSYATQTGAGIARICRCRCGSGGRSCRI